MNGRSIGAVKSDVTDSSPWPDQWAVSRVWTASTSQPVSQRPLVAIRLPGDCTQRNMFTFGSVMLCMFGINWAQ